MRGAAHPRELRALDGARVRRLRAERSIAEDAALDALDISRSQWRRLLSGASAIRLELLVELAGLLGTSCLALAAPSR